MTDSNRISARRLFVGILLAATTCQAAETIDLRSDADAWRRPIAVEAQLRIAGEVIAETAREQDAKPRPIGLTLDLAYLQEALAASQDEPTRVARRVAGETGTHRLLVAETADAGAKVASAGGPLTRAELDAVQFPADPLDLDSLLPGEAVLTTDSWKLAPEAIGRVMRIESVTLCEVIGVVEAASKHHAKIRLAGPVHGLADGAEVEIDLRGVALFDRRSRRLTKLNLAWGETRALGPATPALKATAKLNVRLKPAPAGERLDAVDQLLAETTQPDDRLAITTGDGTWQLLAERDWFVVASDRYATTLRRIEGDRATAVTTLTPPARRMRSLEELEAEVRDSLGKNLHSLLSTETGQIARAGSLLAIASTGQLAGQAVEWRHHQVAADNGPALAATTTLPTPEGPADDTSLQRLIKSLTPAAKTTETAAASATAVRR